MGLVKIFGSDYDSLIDAGSKMDEQKFLFWVSLL